MEGTLSLLDTINGHDEWTPYSATLSNGVLTLSSQSSSFEISISDPSTTNVSTWPDSTGFSVTFANGKNLGFKTSSKAQTSIWAASLAQYVEIQSSQTTQHTLEEPITIPSVNSSIDDTNTSLLHDPETSSTNLSHETKNVLESYEKDLKGEVATRRSECDEGVWGLGIGVEYDNLRGSLRSSSPPKILPLPPRPPKPHLTSSETSAHTHNILNQSTLSLLDTSPNPSPSTSLNLPQTTVSVPITELLKSATSAKETFQDLKNVSAQLSNLKRSHNSELRSLERERDEFERKVERLERRVEEGEEVRKEVERRVEGLSSVRRDERETLEDLKNQVEKYERGVVEMKVKGVDEVREAVEEATEGVEIILKEEREKFSSQRRALERRYDLKLQNELATLEDELRQGHVMDKAVALAEALKAQNSEMFEFKRKVEEKWRRKFDKLQSQTAEAKKATGRDVKQLTSLHQNHVLALEKSLREETSRLDKARQQIKHLTITRASESAKNASDREVNWQSAAENEAEIGELKVMVERLGSQREEAERMAEAAISKAKRMGDDVRLEAAKVQGIRSRLSEAEAECVVLRRENEELKAYRMGGEGIVEVLRRENAILRREGGALKDELERMRGVLGNINGNIYGKKAAEMCSNARLNSSPQTPVRALSGDDDHGNENMVGHLNHLLPAKVSEGIFYSVTKDAGGYNVAKTPAYVDVVFHFFEAEGDGHEGHDHDRHSRRLSGDDESVSGVFEEMHEYYEALASPTATCLNVTAGDEIELTFAHETETTVCKRLQLDNHVFQSAYPLHIEGAEIEEAGIEFFTMAIYRYEAPEEGDHEDEHDGHDHGRVMSEDDHHEEAPESEYPHLGEQFSVRSSKTNTVVGGPEATIVNDKLILDPDAAANTPEKGTSGEAFTACFVVLLVTLTGIIFAIPVVNKMVMVEQGDPAQGAAVKAVEFVERNGVLAAKGGDIEGGKVAPSNAEEARDSVLHPAVIAYSSAFAAGAILSCAFFLVLPEALNMMVNYTKDDPASEGIETESWKWGTAILAGLVFPWIIAIITEQITSCVVKRMGGEFVDKTRIVSGILVGDFFHNFTDGTFVAGAFLLCNSSFGWTVATSTIIHEIAQEIADYFVLTTVCGFSSAMALFLNFLSGVSVIFGCMLVTESDIDPNSLGYLLAFGGGVYISIGATECMPRIFSNSKGLGMALTSFLLFTVGAVSIGLVLLDHKHCETAEMPGHEGHSH
ncbi:hypothetical protein TL16_g04803 [Triparma laevis f. inornata]|uniref:Uncharacterized protein n=1 Tax=Triparma laevis f. inornata TaxID=1714386 RepID=A0A9W7E6L3_9STRA|nr:hypothetical protein TL16_g04803 [Triparma laevis f. inornata]